MSHSLNLQHLIMTHVKCTHPSMPISRTLSTEVRETVPIVDRMQVVFLTCQVFPQSTITTVMAHNLD